MIEQPQLPSESEATTLPVEIAAEEIMLRSLRRVDVNREEMRIKAGSLKPGSSGRGSVSLIREAIGKEQSVSAAVEHVHGDKFWGFGSSPASTLRSHCDSLQDDRDRFLGHAEMVLGFEIPPGPPNTPPDMDEVYEEAMLKLIALALEFTVTEHVATKDSGSN